MHAPDAAERIRRDAAGSVMPLVLVGLATLAFLALAAYEATRFALGAARNQADAAAALHAADSGLDLYLGGAGPPDGPVVVDAPPGRATLSVLLLTRLPDSSRIVHVVSEGRAPAGVARPVVRRLQMLVRLDSTGDRHFVAGSWRERLEDP